MKEVAAFPLVDEKWGEVVAAVIVIEGVSEKDLEEAIRRSWESWGMPKYKCPRRVFIVEKLPKNSGGKVVKRALPEIYADSENGRNAKL